MTLAKGTVFYIDDDKDDTYQDVGCIFGGKPPGLSRGIVDGEACLGDGTITQDTGSLTNTPLQFSMRSAPSETATDMDPVLEAAIRNDTSVNWCILHPLPTAIYQFGSGKLSEMDFDEFEVETEMKRPVEIVLDADYTWSATPPTVNPTDPP